MIANAKRRLIADLERSIVDTRDAIQAIESDDIDGAIESFRSVAGRLQVFITELSSESNDPPAHLAVGARTGRNERSVPNDGGSDE